MGHVLVVAFMGYFCARSLGSLQGRLVNDFLGGLWHDLPEVLTRDIISPIKRSIEGLDELIKEIEQRKMEDVLLPLLPLSWQDDILNFTMDEFRNKIRLEGRGAGTCEKIIHSAFISPASAGFHRLVTGCEKAFFHTPLEALQMSFV